MPDWRLKLGSLINSWWLVSEMERPRSEMQVVKSFFIRMFRVLMSRWEMESLPENEWVVEIFACR